MSEINVAQPPLSQGSATTPTWGTCSAAPASLPSPRPATITTSPGQRPHRDWYHSATALAQPRRFALRFSGGRGGLCCLAQIGPRQSGQLSACCRAISAACRWARSDRLRQQRGLPLANNDCLHLRSTCVACSAPSAADAYRRSGLRTSDRPFVQARPDVAGMRQRCGALHDRTI
jgi:hypothetical protein